MKLSLIVAAAENNVIGNNGDLPWKLRADLQRFKSLTMGHSIIMGRVTFESIGRLLPGRTSVIVTRQSDYQVEGAKVVNSLDAALAMCGEDERPFVIGGAEIYQLALPNVREIYLTRVHADVQGDAYLTEINWADWTLVDSERHSADQKNEFDYSFEIYRRV